MNIYPEMLLSGVVGGGKRMAQHKPWHRLQWQGSCEITCGQVDLPNIDLGDEERRGGYQHGYDDETVRM